MVGDCAHTAQHDAGGNHDGDDNGGGGGGAVRTALAYVPTLVLGILAGVLVATWGSQTKRSTCRRVRHALVIDCHLWTRARVCGWGSVRAWG